MRIAKIVFIFGFVILLSAGMALAQSPGDVATKIRQANADLNTMAVEISKLVTHPGFRGFLRSEIAKSKNREQILELDKFLDRASKQKGMPPGLTKFKDFSGKAKGRLKASGLTVIEGIDLYIPVDAHRKKWQGGKEFIVAFSPVDDEKNVTQIVGYSVKDGKRVILDPKKAPQTVVIVVALCEHITHEKNIVVTDNNPPPKNLKPARMITSPPGKVYKNEMATKEAVGKYPGNSKLYAYYTMFKNDHEPWYAGKPEIEVYIMQECSGGLSFRRFNMEEADSTYKYHYTGKYGYLTFSSDCSDLTLTTIWERDGGSWIRGDCLKFPSGRTHCYNVRSGDDYIAGHNFNTVCDSGLFHKSAFPYQSLYDNVDLGCYGDVQLLKVQ